MLCETYRNLYDPWTRLYQKLRFLFSKSFSPEAVDDNEPENIAAAAEEMGLKYIVITSVTRDDLPDGGAGQFARTIGAIRRRMPLAKIEVLTPDFLGDIGCPQDSAGCRT